MKTQSDVAKGAKPTSKNCTACSPVGSTQPTTRTLSVPAVVPGDLISDLEAAGVRLNWATYLHLAIPFVVLCID